MSLGVGSEVSKALASPGSSLCLMPDPHGVKARALSSRDSAMPVCLLACPHAPHHGGHELQIKSSICAGHRVLPQQRGSN